MNSTPYITASKWAIPDDRDAVKQLINEINQNFTPELGFTIQPLSYDEFVDPDWGADPDDPTAYGFMADKFVDVLVTIWEFTNFVMNRVGTNGTLLRLGSLMDSLILGTDTIEAGPFNHLDL